MEQTIGHFVITTKSGENTKIMFCLGGGFGQDRQIDTAFLCHQKRQNKVHFQHALESVNKSGECKRVIAQRSISEYFDGTMLFNSSPMNGPAAEGFVIKQYTQHFVKQYYSDLKINLSSEHNTTPTYYYGLLGNKDLGHTLDQTKELMQKVTNQNKYWDSLSTKRKSEVLLMAFTICAELRSLINMQNLGNENELIGTHSVACKQGVDRAVAVNACMLACVACLRKGDISSNMKNLLIGMLFGRGLIVENRAMLQNRFGLTIDFLKLIGGNQEIFISHVNGFLEKNGASIEFDTPIQK